MAPDGTDRQEFVATVDAPSSGGGIQFWLDSERDIFVSWRFVSGSLIFDVDQKGKIDAQQNEILLAIYQGIKDRGMDLVGDGLVFSLIFFDE